MTRSTYWLSSSSGSTASLVVTSWMESFGTSVVDRAFEMIVEMALNDSVDSLPPLRIAALADLIANDAMLAMTSGRASKMIRSTPIGHDCRCRMRPSSNSVRKSTLPTEEVSRVFSNVQE